MTTFYPPQSVYPGLNAPTFSVEHDPNTSHQYPPPIPPFPRAFSLGDRKLLLGVTDLCWIWWETIMNTQNAQTAPRPHPAVQQLPDVPTELSQG